MKNITFPLFCTIFLAAGNAQSNFVGPYEFDNWTKTINAGSITTDTNKDSVTLVSSNDDNEFAEEIPTNQDFTIQISTAGLVSFHWVFETNDQDGAKWDPFGYLLNGFFTQISDDFDKEPQYGVLILPVNVGDIFGFRIHSEDSKFGAGTAIVSNFTAPTSVPLPTAVWLFGSGLFGILWKSKRINQPLKA